MKNSNAICRAALVQELAVKNYQSERHDRCKLWIFRNIIAKIYPMSERTFWRYLHQNTSSNEYSGQLTLF